MYRSNFIRNLPSIFFNDFKYQMNYASLNWNCSLRKWFAHFIDCSPFCSSPVVFGAESYVSVYIYVPHAGAELRIPLCCTYTYHEYGATNFLDIFWTKNPWPRPGQKNPRSKFLNWRNCSNGSTSSSNTSTKARRWQWRSISFFICKTILIDSQV